MTVSINVAERTRGMMKRNYIAQAAIIPKLLEERAERMSRLLEQLTRAKDIDEWELYEGLQQEWAELIAELPWSELAKKLVIFQIAELERDRTLVKMAG